jgi:tetratricopeptide (TPR) repeat protein
MRGFELPDKTPHLTSMEAVSILRGLLITAPEHPGVHHYVIHGFEGSAFAKDAWASCARYPELVPGIPHALHMPGHIYSQTGRWGDAAASFSDAATVERRYMTADKLYGSGHHGHNVHYLATALSFEGEYDKARAAAAELLALGENPREKASLDGFFAAYRQGWFAMLRTLVQSESWDEILDGKSLPVYDKPREQAWRHWALSLAHANKSQVDAAREESHLMDAALKDYRDQVKADVPDALQTARAELDGHLKIAEGSIDAGLKKLDQASRMELKMDYSEPPFYPRPVSEAMGQAALRNGRAAEAKAGFERALRQYPASHRAQQGLKALEARATGGS